MLLNARDANVELRQGDLQANDDNVGFVPTLHLSSDYRFAERWMLRFDFDGLAVREDDVAFGVSVWIPGHVTDRPGEIEELLAPAILQRLER